MRKRHFFTLWLALTPVIASAHDDKVVIRGRVIIDSPVVYANTTLEFQNGSLLITNKASLTVINSRIEGTLSPAFSPLFEVLDGRLTLSHNTVAVTAVNIPPSPLSAPKYALISIHSGSTTLTDNDFSIDKPYTAALLLTGAAATTGITATGNAVNFFHGGFMLQNSSDGRISKNIFFRVSCGNIYIKNSQHIQSDSNMIFFSGNNNVGDGFDVVDSDDIRITDNHIFSGSCYSIFVMRGSNVLIADNSVSGGITYAVYATDALAALHPSYAYLSVFEKNDGKTAFHRDNDNITITGNYFSQNRYGLAASHVNGLTVQDNIFIQHFKNSRSRQFWTSNDMLLKDISGLNWSDNLYKEAFSQDIHSENKKSRHFVRFPEHNGVVFE